ncbi:MAG: regulator of sigma E protease [Bradymonadia bacterium]|jgi:regulator of sigma E protease
MNSTQLLIAIFGFSLLIIIHELGHFLVARWSGMTVHTFSIGFGPALVKIQGPQTLYKISLFPVGGYVQVAGMAGEKDFSKGSYNDASLWKRAAMVSAGPVFNFGLAAVIYLGLFGTFNALAYEWDRVPTATLRAAEGPAFEAGLQPGDTILQIDDTPILSFRDLRKTVGASDGAPMQVTVARPKGGVPDYEEKSVEQIQPGLVMRIPRAPADAEKITVQITPRKAKKGWQLGISPALARFGADGVVSAFKLAAIESYNTIAMTVKFVARAFQGDPDVKIVSVVKITKLGADSIKRGWEWFFSLLAMLSINLGFLNLLPFPALDGGRLVFIFYEAIAGRPAPRKVEAVIHAVGMVMLMGLIFLVTMRDIFG